jgi:hypothetical protein
MAKFLQPSSPIMRLRRLLSIWSSRNYGTDFRFSIREILLQFRIKLLNFGTKLSCYIFSRFIILKSSFVIF